MRRWMIGSFIVALAVMAMWVRTGDAHHGEEGMSATPAGTPAAMAMGAAYLTITNNGTEPDRLVGGTTAVAKVVEIHEVVNKDGVMQMRPLANGLDIPAGETVELKPGGYHIMLIGLTRDLKVGDRYELTLHFEKAGEVTLTVDVRPAAEPGAGTPVASVMVGDLAISNVWSRPAPAMAGAMNHGTPEATPGMHDM
jgi:hypothetical protein